MPSVSPLNTPLRVSLATFPLATECYSIRIDFALLASFVGLFVFVIRVFKVTQRCRSVICVSSFSRHWNGDQICVGSEKTNKQKGPPIEMRQRCHRLLFWFFLFLSTNQIASLARARTDQPPTGFRRTSINTEVKEIERRSRDHATRS